MSKRHVTIRIHDVWVHGKRVDNLKVKVPIPTGLTKAERRAYSDGAAEATPAILNATQPRMTTFRTGFQRTENQ